MTSLPKSLAIHEVGPREGFQFEKGAIATDRKIELVDALSEAGLKEIQVTSFVSPKWVPQMADAEEITDRFKKVPGVSYNALFLNTQGLLRVLAYSEVYDVVGNLGMIATDIFSKMNTNKTIAESVAALPDRIAVYKEHGIPVTMVSMMAAFGCNYQGDVPLNDVLGLLKVGIDLAAAHGEQINRVRLSDTMGWGNPLQMKQTIGAVQDRWPEVAISLHLHDTRGTAMANAAAAIELGVREFDASVGGLGGCPFAKHKGSAGNIVSEDLAFMAEEMGIATGVDLERLIQCAALAEDVVGHSLPSKLLRGGSLTTIREASRAGATA